MFCSNCGKTVGAEDRYCPHCNIELGDVRFMGMPYTSVQFRIVPGKPMPIDEAYAYTRKDYSVDIESDDLEPVTESVEGEDVENATTYRPVMPGEPEVTEEEAAEEEAAEEAPVEPELEDAVDVDPENLSEEQIDAALEKLRARGVDTGILEESETEEEYTEETPDEGIAERLEQYERDAVEGAERSRRGLRSKIRLPFGGRKAYDGVDDSDEADAEYEEPADDIVYDGSDAEPVDEEYVGSAEGEAEVEPQQAEAEYEQYGEYGNDDVVDDGAAFSIGEWMNKQVFGIRLANILKCAGALVVFVICLSLGLKWFGYVSQAQKKSPIDGVTLSLYESGIDAIVANAGEEKIDAMLNAYMDSGVLAFTALQQQHTDALKALMPEEPGVNDQLFMDTLTHIQENIANAVIADAMSGDPDSADSKQNWATIQSAIDSLKGAKDSVQLQAIVNEKVQIVASTVEPTATPVRYKVLTRGDEGTDVKKLQQRLFDLGYLADAPDGKFGNKTTTAIKYFQMGHELNVTGIADAATQAMLHSEEALDMEAAKAAYQARQAEAGN